MFLYILYGPLFFNHIRDIRPLKGVGKSYMLLNALYGFLFISEKIGRHR